MGEASEVKDFFGHDLRPGDIATAVLEDHDGSWLALVRVEEVYPPHYAAVHVLNTEENPGFSSWRPWHRKLIWCSSDYADMPDTLVKEVFKGVSAD